MDFIERINLAAGNFFEDGKHILYVNGNYCGESDLGKLMHDFNCTQADDMYFELMAERTRYLKENPKGVDEMCRIMEEMRNKSLKQGSIATLSLIYILMVILLYSELHLKPKCLNQAFLKLQKNL